MVDTIAEPLRDNSVGGAALVAPSRASHIAALTGLRAAAAAGVMLYHFREVGPSVFFQFGPFDPLIRQASVGVDVFFVLSGFVICHAYARVFATSVSVPLYRDFLRNRLARLYPIHLATLAGMLVLFVIGLAVFRVVPNNAASYTGRSIAHNLLLTHAWFPGVGAPNTPAWSISAEWFAYLLFPPLCCLSRKRPSWLLAALAAVMVIAAQLLGPLHPLFRVASEFSLGMWTCELVQRSSGTFIGWRLGALCVLVVFVLVQLTTHDPDAWLGIYAFLTACLLVCLVNDADVVGRLFRHRALVYVGEISYSIYMCHWLVWSVMKHAAHSSLPILIRYPLLQVAIGIVMTFCLAAFAYHHIEQPGRRAIRGRRQHASERAIEAL
jgi:peptidoglycan/LPS O-acetylase OafA/YrhL